MDLTQKCHQCDKRCPQAELACETAKSRMYATNEVIRLQKELQTYKDAEESGLLFKLPCEEVWFVVDRFEQQQSEDYIYVNNRPIKSLTLNEILGIDKDGIFWSSKEKANAELIKVKKKHPKKQEKK